MDAYKSYPLRANALPHLLGQDLAHNMVEWGMGCVIMRQGLAWAFAKSFYTREPLKWWSN